MMEIEKAIKERIPIDIDLYPDRDIIYSGVCLKSNLNIWILVNYNSELKEFDGFTVFRNEEVNNYRIWDKEEVKEIKNFNLDSFSDCIKIDKIDSFHSLFKELTNNYFIAFFTDGEDSYFVGKITFVDETKIKVDLIDEEAKFLRNHFFDISTINYISFGTTYETGLQYKAIKGIVS